MKIRLGTALCNIAFRLTATSKNRKILVRFSKGAVKILMSYHLLLTVLPTRKKIEFSRAYYFYCKSKIEKSYYMVKSSFAKHR